MEEQMKISSAVVRRLRTERGWSQEQLAMASGLGLRTIQRVEADGTASMGTKVCLAATFGAQLGELSDETGNAEAGANSQAQHVVALFVGIAVLTCVFMGESGRLPGSPTSSALAAINAVLALVGTVLIIPAVRRLVAQRRYAGVVLTVLGMPLAILFVAGSLVATSNGHGPASPLAAFGIGGMALVVMALRDFWQEKKQTE